jgi:hypothetical protein
MSAQLDRCGQTTSFNVISCVLRPEASEICILSLKPINMKGLVRKCALKMFLSSVFLESVLMQR